MRKFYFALAAMLFCAPTFLFAQNDRLWTAVDESAVSSTVFSGRTKPTAFKLFRLSEASMKTILQAAPAERNVHAERSSHSIELPYLDGKLTRFRITNAPVIDPELARKFPGIESYAGVSEEYPGVTVRFSFSELGLHAMISSPDRAVMYIDAVGARTEQLYQVAFRSDVPATTSTFRCLTENETAPAGQSARGESANDGKLRTYRLAMATAPAFSSFFLNGTEVDDQARKAKVIAALVIHMTRANAIMERDFSIRLVLIGDNDKIVFLSPENPFPSPGTRNNRTQVVIDSAIGNQNYDIGHSVHRDDDNGNAGCIGCVCNGPVKGRGWTAYWNLAATEWYVVDYLTHEIGHQLGANHTWAARYEQGSNVLMEPGSGSTIMSYAGIVEGANVQAHTDPYFHAVSIAQVTSYMYDGLGNSCAVATPTNNVAPVTNAGADYVIPRSTPFTLTGSATDGNAGDVLSYTWEQYDPAPATQVLPNTTRTTGPAFRSYGLFSEPVRHFPILSAILSGANDAPFEKLPSVSRSLNFRLTTRDNKLNGGANSFDDMTVTTTANSGPFRVLSPNTAVEWTTESTQTITWDVANSNQAPVSCANVSILLSTDGGLTFPITLVASTPNDGTHDITVPNTSSTQCRIKVQGVGNIFFDIGNANFSISAPFADFLFDSPSAATVTCGTATSVSTTLNLTTVNGFNSPVTLSATGNPAGTTVVFGTSTLTPPGSSTVTLNGVNTLPQGTYTITVTGTGGSRTKQRQLTFTVAPGAGPVVTTAPQSVEVCEGEPITLSVSTTGTVTAYQWQLSSDGGTTYTNIASATTATYTVPQTLASQNNQRFRVVLTGPCNTTITSPATLTVLEKSQISISANTTSITPGQTATITATATPATGVTYNWIYNGGQSVGTGSTIDVGIQSVGDYQVNITNASSCTNSSEVLRITAQASDRLFIYPTPNDGQFTVSYYYSGTATTQQMITVYDSRGGMVYNAAMTVNSPYQLHSINLRGNARGLYYVVIGDASGKKLKEGKVVIN